MAFNGARARERRVELGLSQFQLCEKIRAASIATGNEPVIIRPEYISSYENGSGAPGRTNFLHLVRALDLPATELETGL